MKEFGEDSAQARHEAAGIPPKYFNSIQGTDERDGSPLLNKSERLFGFHRAKLGGAPLYLFEGQGDVATAHHFGLKNSVGLGMSGLTERQLRLLLRYEVPHIVLCLDADAGGWRGIRQCVELMDRVRPPSWFLAEIMFLPVGADDPDAFIRAHGIEAFQQLPKWDLFTWKVHDLVTSRSSRQDLYNRLIQLAMQEPSPLRRWQMCQIIGPEIQVPANVAYAETFNREKKPIEPVLKLRVNPTGGVSLETPITEFLAKRPITLMDCYARIVVDTGKAKPDLADDRIYYPARTH